MARKKRRPRDYGTTISEQRKRWAPPERFRPLAQPGAVMTALDWRQRRGVKIPRVECLAPFDRVGVAEFTRLMEEMGAGGLDLGDLVAP